VAAEIEPMQRLVVYSDYVCPFCYLADSVVARLRGEGLQCEYRAFELRPAPAPLIDGDNDYIQRAWTESVVPLAARLDVEIHRPKIHLRSQKAHEAVAFARERGRVDEMHAAVFRAFFLQGMDIGRIDLLVGIGEALGLDRTELRVALDIDRYTEAVLAVERSAVQEGIVGVPTFITESGERMVGVQSYDALRVALSA
jgi:predicted DsbA family dithiol-disulfide isomerase